MSKYQRGLILLFSFGALAVIGTLMNPKQGAAAGGPSVTIDGPLPLPISGTVTATGTVAATQSGTWNVAISGTPSVNVANTAFAPVQSLNVNDPGRIPYQSVVKSPTCGASFCAAQFAEVPSGHRLVAEHFSFVAYFNGSPGPLTGSIGTVGFPYMLNFFVPQPAGGGPSALDLPIRAYYDNPGQLPYASVGWSSSSGATASSGVYFTLIGYMLDCTVSACQAITQ